MDNNYGGWSTYNGEFAHCRTRSGLTPEQIETIAYEEQQKLNVKRVRRLFRGDINFSKSHPGFMAKWFTHCAVPEIVRGIRQRHFTPTEKAREHRQRKIAMNQFNI